MRLFSVRHEFPSEWARFKRVKIEGGTKIAELALNLQEGHYPFWSRDRLEATKRVDVFAKPAQATKATIQIFRKQDGTETKEGLEKDASLGNLRAGKLTDPLPEPTGELILNFDDNSMEDLWLAVAWGKE